MSEGLLPGWGKWDGLYGGLWGAEPPFASYLRYWGWGTVTQGLSSSISHTFGQNPLGGTGG